jgi:nitrite reductase/ring-hydroxylating ferredoxin subunit
MREVNLGLVSAFSDPGRKVVEIDGVEIGVFHVKGQFTAYGNICPHMGGRSQEPRLRILENSD